MTDQASGRPRITALPQPEWPRAIAEAWAAALRRLQGPFKITRRHLSPRTIECYTSGLGLYLGFLKQTDALVSVNGPKALVTTERLAEYFQFMRRAGNRDYTIRERFHSLYGAMRHLDPDGDHTGIVRPDGVPLSDALDLHTRSVFTPDARHAVLWAERLFRDAGSLRNRMHRCTQVRDAAMLAILASRAPRVGTLLQLRLGQHVVRRGEEWVLSLPAPIMKGRRRSLVLPLGRRVSAILTRYIEVERVELLRGQQHDALWVANHGGPMTIGAIGSAVRHRAVREFGEEFGPHRFRHALTTTQAVIGGVNPFDAPVMLGHSPEVSREHYNHATALQVSRDHGDWMDAAEAAAIADLARLGDRLAGRDRGDHVQQDDGHTDQPAGRDGQSEAAPAASAPVRPADSFRLTPFATRSSRRSFSLGRYRG